MINIKSLQTSKRLDEKRFLHLCNGENGEPLLTDDGKKIGVEIYSMHSFSFRDALRDTVDLDLSQEEKTKRADILKWIEEGVKPSAESKDFLSYCEKKTKDRFVKVYAKITSSLVNFKISESDAKELDVKLTNSGDIVNSQQNIYKLYLQLPDLTTQIGDFAADKKNFTSSSKKS